MSETLITITENGVTEIPNLSPRGLAVLDISGDFQGARVTFGYIGGDDEFTAFYDDNDKPVGVRERRGYEARIPHSGILALLIKDGDEMELKVAVTVSA